ncbi:hypothetical protein [Methanogenium cariaci]|uniref:hypothetical protein n=1 Tax=Methanogenium cariaci TaxID=2197 RepID=UPI00155D9C1A|nr:hypothetical protein [Methanogenium cariaci]
MSRGTRHCVVRVGTNAPQGKRLEFGFVGRDVLGRYYNQEAQPHLRPAVDENVDEVREEIRAAMRQLVLQGGCSDGRRYGRCPHCPAQCARGK